VLRLALTNEIAIIGFIIMLAPIAGLDASDKSMMKSSMGLMSDGMARLAKRAKFRKIATNSLEPTSGE
jgi:hypothetical protein